MHPATASLLIGLGLLLPAAGAPRPGPDGSPLESNEQRTLEWLERIHQAQIRVQVRGTIDGNGDGFGEFGFFGELAGEDPVRVNGGAIGTERIDPPLLPIGFGRVSQSRTERSGYLYQMFLPGSGAEFVPEARRGGSVASTISGQNSAVAWCCYAWPVEYGVTGRRAFFIDARGITLINENRSTRYGGHDRAPIPQAAYPSRDSTMLDPNARDRLGADGEFWAAYDEGQWTRFTRRLQRAVLDPMAEAFASNIGTLRSDGER